MFMTRIRLLLLVTVLGLVAACGKAPETQVPAPAPAPAATANESAAPAPIAAPDPVADTATDAMPVVAAVEESAATEVAAPADNGALGKEIVLAANSSGTPAKADWKYAEGEYFSALTAAQGTSSAPGKIEVAEVFWYGCPHCYDLEPKIADWVKKLPADVAFVRIPVIWNPTNEIHGRIYYTAQALGKVDQIHPAMFRAIHVENRQLTDEKDILQFFEQHGVSAADFNKTFRSFSVDSQLKRAKDLTTKYHVRGVPLLVIDGKYTTDGPKIRNHDELLTVTEELIQRERQRT
jgi:thiol:disulfide interchange protein DsbA